MRTLIFAGGCALLLGAAAYAGPEVIIKQKAKDLRDQSNSRQGVAPSVQPVAPTPAMTAPPPPTAQQLSLNRFQTALAGIKEPVTAAQKRQLAGDLLGAAQGTRPSAAAVDKVVDGLTAALEKKPLPAASRARLAQELDAVLNPGKYPQAKLPAIFADIQAMFQANGLSRTEASAIAESVKALSAPAP